MLLTPTLEFLALPWLPLSLFHYRSVPEGDERAAGRGLALGLQVFLSLLKPQSSAPQHHLP